jgi:1,4-dihydroxy-2-naphthoyl-CoA hydrolase
MKVQGSIEFNVIEQSGDRVVSEMPVTAGIKNPYGIVQAGAVLWFADVTASILVMGPQEMAEGMKGFPLAINLNANFISNQTEGTFKAISSFVKRGRTVSVVRTTVHGAGDKLIADVTTSHVLSK